MGELATSAISNLSRDQSTDKHITDGFAEAALSRLVQRDFVIQKSVG